MEITFEFWYLFPISILIATIAMSSGVGGAVFFSPLFMLVLQLEPKEAIGAALLTELFGFASGLFAYYRSQLIDFTLAKNLLIFSLPMAVLGSLYADLIPGIVLKAVFAAGLLFIGYQLFASWRKEEREKQEMANKKEFEQLYERKITDNHGNTYQYTVCNKNMGRLFAAIGGAFVGMISVGLAELQEYHLVARCRVPTPVAVATSIFVVVITVLVASAGHIFEFSRSGGSEISLILSVVVFTIPGVVIGGQLGPKLQKVVPEDKMKMAISLLFVGIGLLMFYTLLPGV